jgi:hypothetical protein
MKLATTTIILVALIAILVATLIAGTPWVSAPRLPRGLRHLPQLVGATARLVATAVVPLNEASLLAAAQDFAAVQVQRHRIVTRPALPGNQLRVQHARLTRWR